MVNKLAVSCYKGTKPAREPRTRAELHTDDRWCRVVEVVRNFSCDPIHLALVVNFGQSATSLGYTRAKPLRMEEICSGHFKGELVGTPFPLLNCCWYARERR